MAYSFDQSNGDLVIAGWEQGIFPSPHQGLGNIKCANIATETGEVMCNYARVMKTNPIGATGTITTVVSSGSDFPYAFTANPPASGYAQAGVWINVISSTITGLSTGKYYVRQSFQTGAKTFQLATSYKGSAISYSSTGTATFDMSTYAMGQPVAKATEQYLDVNLSTQYRYYIADNNGRVWVNDTGDTTIGLTWANIDTTSFTQGLTTAMAVYDGWLFLFVANKIYVKSTISPAIAQSTGSAGWDTYTSLNNTPPGVNNPHTGYVGRQSTLYYCDGNFIGSIFANSGIPNSWFAGTVNFPSTNNVRIVFSGGSIPYVGQIVTFTSSAGSSGLPTPLTATDPFYVVSVSPQTDNSVWITVSTTKGGSAIASFGALSGTIYINSFSPLVSASHVYSPQALTLSSDEVTQSLTEIGNALIIGCQSNVLYQWDQASAQASGIIFLPENNAVKMITVNNMAYIFAGQKGNIYVTNGSTASVVLTIPDYITGIIEPYFTWGDAMYVRGRVWFSIQDQTASHTGQCGGVWSFIPTQNFFLGQDTGLALRLENQNSYGTYNGMATVLIPTQNQLANGVQYFSGWISSISSSTYGADSSDTIPYTGAQTIIETDLIPIGTYINRGNFSSIQTRYAAALVSGESVQIKWRKDLNAAWATADTDSTVGSLGKRFNLPFANLQNVQLQIILTSTSTTPSFTRFQELRLTK